MTTFVARYDFRAPGADRASRQELFGRALDQAAYLDEHGHDALMVSEHHASDDGYLPSPLVATAAVAARTSRIPITVSALLVNFYEPVKLAEDVAVLDHLSGGRVSYTFGLGYRPEEYALFGQPWKTRGCRHRAAHRAPAGAVARGGGRARRPSGGHHAVALQRPAPVPVLRRRLPRRRAPGGPAGPELPAQRRREGAARDLRRRVPPPGPRARLRPAAPDGSGDGVLRGGPRPLLGDVRRAPAGRRDGLPRVGDDRRDQRTDHRRLLDGGGAACGRPLRRPRPGRAGPPVPVQGAARGLQPPDVRRTARRSRRGRASG